MNSTLQAKLHYDGKPHQKKVSMFLNQSVKKQKTEDGQVSSTTSDWQNYCDVRLIKHGINERGGVEEAWGVGGNGGEMANMVGKRRSIFFADL